MKVILTDGNFKHTLAATRSLGKNGIDVGVVSHMRSSIAFRSKYCKYKHMAPESREPGFGDRLVEIAKGYDAVIPVSYAAVMAASKKRAELGWRVALPSPAALAIAGHKGLTMIYADNIGLTIPRTFHPGNASEYMNIMLSGMDYPLVIKSPLDSGNMVYARNDTEFVQAQFKVNPCIVQEYIKGEGYGFFALYNHGKLETYFMHHRLKEYPLAGGPSVVAESIYDEKLLEEGKKILDGLEWHGPAMVEFKKDENGRFVLMEINPKLWGSLELGIAAGIDFPYKLCEIIMKGRTNNNPYKDGIKFRWPFPQDALRALSTRNIGQFIRDFRDPTLQTDIDIHDIMPNIFQIPMTVGELLLRGLK